VGKSRVTGCGPISESSDLHGRSNDELEEEGQLNSSIAESPPCYLDLDESVCCHLFANCSAVYELYSYYLEEIGNTHYTSHPEQVSEPDNSLLDRNLSINPHFDVHPTTFYFYVHL
jgi:hypothetical protein